MTVLIGRAYPTESDTVVVLACDLLSVSVPTDPFVLALTSGGSGANSHESNDLVPDRSVYQLFQGFESFFQRSYDIAKGIHFETELFELGRTCCGVR